MILRDADSNTIGPATGTGLLHERLEEEKIENGNIVFTAGGMGIKQADSDYFKLPLKVRCTKDQFNIMRTIALNKNKRKYYTPRRVLKGETAIREIEIIFEEIPNVPTGKTYSNNIVEASMIMLEVLT